MQPNFVIGLTQEQLKQLRNDELKRKKELKICDKKHKGHFK